MVLSPCIATFFTGKKSWQVIKIRDIMAGMVFFHVHVQSASMGPKLRLLRSLTKQPSLFDIPAFALRGGANDASSSFDFDLANTRLEGLGYDIIAALILNAALALFSSTPRTLEPIPENKDKAKVVKLVST